MAERGAFGTFNVTGPETTLRLDDFLQRCPAATGAEARFTWVEEGFLREQGLRPWTDLPLWLPRELAAVHTSPADRALGAGLRLRPLEETVVDTLEWARQAGPGQPQVDAGGRVRTPAGISREREAELLRLWGGGSG
jgi:2'-hydroxyisoflavone reductase